MPEVKNTTRASTALHLTASQSSFLQTNNIYINNFSCPTAKKTTERLFCWTFITVTIGGYESSYTRGVYLYKPFFYLLWPAAVLDSKDHIVYANLHCYCAIEQKMLPLPCTQKLTKTGSTSYPKKYIWA